MKVLYCNPIFLDYRLPFYKRLNELFDGNFYVMYSTVRYKLRHNEHLLKQIPEVLGRNALPFENEKLFNTYEMSFKKYNGRQGKRIPITKGLIRSIKKIKPDVLISEGFFQWTPLVLLYSILTLTPLFIGYERTPHTERNAKRIITWQRKFFNLFIKGYLVNGKETQKYLESIGIKSKKIHIGGMSADGKGLAEAVKNYNPQNEDNEFIKSLLNIKQEKKGLIYLFSGQIHTPKGVPHLLLAWETHIKKNPKDQLVLIGKGEEYDYLKDKYATYDSIHFLGFIAYQYVYKYYAIADVFILPTLQDDWSLVIPEAMACGLPVATSIYNGCYSELIKEDVNGTIFDPLKNDSMLKALEYFHHHDLKAMGQASIELEKPFNTENCAQREYDAIIRSLDKKTGK